MSLEKQKEKDLSQSIPEKINKDEWMLLFNSPDEAHKMQSIASQLIKSGLGKRKVKKGKTYVLESDLEYMLRVQYCGEMNIPYCLVNKTYMMEGTVSQMVEIKASKFNKAYPDNEMETVMSSATKCIKKARCSPEHNWIQVEWTLEKAKKLKIYHDSKAQWTENSQGMLSNRCDGQLYDILGGAKINGTGFLTVEEVNSVGIEL